MPTLKDTVDGFVASREFDKATLSRLAYWTDTLGERELAAITADEVDQAIVALAERGRVWAGRNRAVRRTGRPLAGSSLNRYVGQLASVYRYARRLRLLPRTFVPPTRGIEKAPENAHHDRYLRPEQVEKILAVGRLLDRKWGRLEALILVAYHTGMRKQSCLSLRWRDVDLVSRTVAVQRTKNGDPIVAPLSERAAAALGKLANKDPHRLVFEGKEGQPFDIRRLWERACTEAGLPRRNFHQLRHGCGSALAAAGASQAQIMAVLGHRTLTASRRYIHQNVEDKRAVVDRVFGVAA
jgi:integrase